MSIDIKDRIGFLLHSLKSSRKKITALLLTAAFVAVLLFLSGSFYFLFRYYESINSTYYKSIMRGVYSFQDEIIHQGSYRDDLTRITRALQKNRGVEKAWVTDRYGRLIFHTDSSVLEEYGSRRLPAEYYENIELVWQFHDGYPRIKIVPLKGWLTQRISFPLYPFGREDADFIIGMDVTRFVNLPDRLQLLIPFSAVYMVVAILLLFFPSFFLIRMKLQTIESQTGFFMSRTMPPQAVPEIAGATVESAAPEAAAEQPQEAETVGPAKKQAEPSAPDASETTVERKPAEEAKLESKLEVKEEAKEEAEVKEEKEEVVESALKGDAAKSAVEIKEAKPAAEKKSTKPEAEKTPAVGDKMRETFLKLKAMHFKKHAAELSFVQANSYIFHSKGVEGAYLFYHQAGKSHFYLAYSVPEGDSESLYEQIPGLRAGFRGSLAEGAQLKDLLVLYNDLCLARKLSVDLSLVHINENTKNVEYSSCGSATACYLKQGEEEVKTLVFDYPRLGELAKKDFSDKVHTADIRFGRDDIFIVLPPNAEDIKLEKEQFDSLIKKTILRDRSLSAQTIGMEVVNRIESLPEEQKKTLPETGFIVLKFF